MSTEPFYVNLDEAARLAGSPSKGAIRKWINRWNHDHPEMPIKRRHGVVELASFRAALDADAERYSHSIDRITRIAADAMRSDRRRRK